MTSIKISHRAYIGDKCAIVISRALATWLSITFLCIGEASYIVIKHLYEGSALDVHNLCISLFTLFLDLIILKATISLRNLDRELTEKILKSEHNILKEVKQIANKVDYLLGNDYAHEKNNK